MRHDYKRSTFNGISRHDCILTLRAAGISLDDAIALRRISMTLHRWHELECGTDHMCMVRGYWNQETMTFDYDDSGKAYLEFAGYSGKARYQITIDRERGALKRLAKIMARYPAFWVYVQTDPRGCSLYVGKIDDLPIDARGESHPMGQPLDLSSHYNRGIAVYK